MYCQLLKFTNKICIVTTASICLLLGLNVANISLANSNIAQAQTSEKQVNPTRVSTAEINQLSRLFPKNTLIPNQTFRVNLLECGTCLFVPTKSQEGRLNIHLVKNNKIILTFPQSSKIVPTSWRLFELKAVSFVQLNFASPNEDGIIIISDYVTGIGRQGAIPFPIATVYGRKQNSKGFQLLEKESRVLIDRRVSTINQAEKILRNEFKYLP